MAYKTTAIQTVGRRKTAIASVDLFPADETSVKVNGKTPKEYFKTDERVETAMEAFKAADAAKTYRVVAHVSGGGVSAQAGALRHAIARALIEAEAPTRKALKAIGYLRRDPRAKERKKPGLKKARKAPQWSKR